MIQNFKEKYQRLPASVLPYFETEAATEANIYLVKKFNLTEEQEWLHTELLSQLFFKDVLLKDLVTRIVSLFSFERERALELALDIAGIKLLPIKNWLGEDVAGYIRALGGDPAIYAPFIKELDEEIAKEMSSDAAAVEDEPAFAEATVSKDEDETDLVSEASAEVTFDIEREKRDSLEVFRNRLKNFFGIYDHPFLEFYNEVLIEALTDDANFKKDLEECLYANSELLTTSPIELEGHEVAPTIANWLKVFIKEQGTDYYNDLKLTDFIVNSANAKPLNEDERVYLKRLLLLYRNLHFFPHAFVGRPESDWEIIPFERNIEAVAQETVPPSTIKTQEEINIINLRKAGKAVIADSLAFDAVNEEIERQQKIEGLKILVKRYPQGSLERRAVEGEIRKLETL